MKIKIIDLIHAIVSTVFLILAIVLAAAGYPAHWSFVTVPLSILALKFWIVWSDNRKV